MVIKKEFVGQSRKYRSGPQVCLPKLDITAYRVVPSTSQLASTSCVKKETTPCFFNSEVDLNDDVNNVIVEERTLACQCGFCSPLYELKDQMRQEFLAQQAANSPLEPPVYEFPGIDFEERDLPPQPVFATNFGTQTERKVYRFTCRDCGSEFNEEHFFEHHRKIHVKMLECAFCDAQFLGEKQLTAHLFLHLRKTVYECVYCQAVYCNKKYLNEHLRIHEKFVFACNKCSAKFETNQYLQLHKKTHSSSGSLVHVFRRLRADQAPPDDEDVTVEMITAVPVQMEQPKLRNEFFECDKCHLKFKRHNDLQRHGIIHNRKGRCFLHFCIKCDARFRSSGHLMIHIKAAHKDNIKN